MINNISGFERQSQILQLIQRCQRISITEICSKFRVSEATARRDLEVLAGEGKVRRVHGGAVTLDETPPEQPILQRQAEQAQEKARIGQAAAGLILDGETVFLGSGTTVLEVARALRSRHSLTVLTNSLPVINVLAGVAGMTVICLGGMLRDSELSFIGHITENALAEVRADRVVIGTRAISLEHGLSHEYLPETMTDRAILKAGREIIVVADHTKFGREAALLLTPIAAIHTIVTDQEVARDFIDSASKFGIQVIQA